MCQQMRPDDQPTVTFMRLDTEKISDFSSTQALCNNCESNNAERERL